MTNTTSKNISFFLDGKKKSERTWTESDAKVVPIIFAAANEGLDDAAFGFSSLTAFERWLAKNGLANEYAKGKAILDRTPKELSGRQKKELRLLQAKVVSENSANFEKILRDAKLSPENIGSEVINFVTNYNPHTGPILSSAILYENIDTKGKFIYLPTGWSLPNFKWMNFNDMCSSVVCHGGNIFLWEHTFYTGRRIVLFSYPMKVYNIDGYPFYFNDTASSANTW